MNCNSIININIDVNYFESFTIGKTMLSITAELIAISKQHTTRNRNGAKDPIRKQLDDNDCKRDGRQGINKCSVAAGAVNKESGVRW